MTMLSRFQLNARFQPVSAVTPQGVSDSTTGHGDFARELRILTRGSSFGLIGQIANVVLAFAFSLAVGRLFHAQGTGTFFEALAIFTIACNIGDLGADDGLAWAVPRLRSEQRSADVRRLLPIACAPVLVLSTCLAIAVFVGAGPIAHLFTHGVKASHLRSFIRILAPFVPIAALVQVAISGTRGFDRVWPLAGIWLFVTPLLRLILLPVLVLSGVGLLAVAYSWAIPTVLGALALVWVLWMLAESEHRLSTNGAVAVPRRDLARQFWSFSAPRAVASVCQMGLIWLDVLLVGYFVSLPMAGVYGVASRYLVIITYTLIAVGGTIAPQVSRLLTLGKLDDFRRLYQTATSWIMAIAWPCALMLAIFSPFLMRIFGKGFVVGHTALTILALTMLFVAATGNNLGILVVSGRTRTSLWIGMLALGLNVGLNLWLIPFIGINGAAIAWAISLVVSNSLISLVLYRSYRLHPFSPAFFRVAATSVLVVGLPALVCRVVLGADLPAFLLTSLAAGGAYLAIMWRARGHLQLGSLLARQPS
jgi:O-antigen/teichoic acid export membrane protein